MRVAFNCDKKITGSRVRITSKSNTGSNKFLVCIAISLLLCAFSPHLRVLGTEEGQTELESEVSSVTKSMKGLNFKAQRAAVKAWSRALTAADYNASDWVVRFNKQPANFFEHYASKLSDLFVEKGAMVNFAMVGACDGTNDRTIRDRYLPNKNWRGVFVEPISFNFKDLSDFMHKHDVMDRTYLIHGAATSKCDSPEIKMKRPDFEERNASLPHWMRRQIGAIVPFNKLDRPMTGGWKAEFVRCVTGDDILKEWAAEIGKQSGEDAEKFKSRRVKKMCPHVLKVDVEGHDYDVLMGFLRDDYPNSELPLLINFEAKSIAKKWDDLKAHLEKKGYAVSHFATDGFAMLRGTNLFKSRQDRAEGYTPKGPDAPGAELRKDGRAGGGGKRKRKGGAGGRKKKAASEGF